MVDGMSIREASGVFGLHRDTVRKMLAHSVPPGYRRRKPPRRPKIGPYTGVIDRILEDDLNLPKKQRHTAKRIHERLREEYGFDGGYTIVKDYVRIRQIHRLKKTEDLVGACYKAGYDGKCRYKTITNEVKLLCRKHVCLSTTPRRVSRQE